MATMKRYRATFATGPRALVTLDYVADNLGLAKDHARHCAYDMGRSFDGGLTFLFTRRLRADRPEQTPGQFVVVPGTSGRAF